MKESFSISTSFSCLFKISLAGTYKNVVIGREKKVKKSEQMNESRPSKFKTFISAFK